MIRILLVVWVFSLGLMSQAMALPGASDPDFRKAVALWLDDDDRHSLPELARLAEDGNVAARLLLSRIERTDRGPSPYVRTLSDQQRLALFRPRSDGGRFHPSWLMVEMQKKNALARMLQMAGRPQVDVELIRGLRDAGELQATDHPTRIAALYGTHGLRQLLLDEKLVLPELVPYVLYNRLAPEPRGDGIAALRWIVQPRTPDLVSPDDPETLSMAGLLALGFGYGSLSPDNRWYKYVENWVLRSEAARPVADFCQRSCGSDKKACAMTMLALTGGYYEVIRLDSPLESVIGQERFLASKRARQSAFRRAAMARSETDDWLATIPEIARHSVCLANQVDAHRALFEAGDLKQDESQ
ncbi:hypothetical protein [Coralliovum pocilloporae]|uniref:hypothetical protein n=1 Tax=Coralliovum pocilloporae TaxID=3066369 RepID=UPI0033077A7A